MGLSAALPALIEAVVQEGETNSRVLVNPITIRPREVITSHDDIFSLKFAI